MSFNLKEALDGIFLKKDYTVSSDYSQFAINMYMCKYRSFASIVSPLLCLNLPNQAHFDYLKRHIGFGWPSKVDTPKKKADEVPIEEYVMKFYECSRLDADDYLKFMSERDIKDLIEFYKEE